MLLVNFLEYYKQTEYKDKEEGDDAPPNAADDNNKPFFAPSEGVSFRANSFMELNLSRPLLRALEKLGHTKPTPIQVQNSIPMTDNSFLVILP